MPSEPTSPSSTDRTISRRRLAAGVAWSVPAVALATAAPSFATSRNAIGSSICALYYGAGDLNTQTHSIYLGISATEGKIPAGTTLTWTINVTGGGPGTGGTNEVPTTNYSDNNMWKLTLSQTPGDAIAGGSFTATITFNTDYQLPTGTATWCGPALVWTNIYSIRPGATVTVTTSGSVPTNGGAYTGPGSLKYNVAKRAPTGVNVGGRVPHVFLSKSGKQACYPEVRMSQLMENDGADDVVTYPAGTNITTPRCNWGGTTCFANATGLSTPPYKSPQAGQLNIPAMC